MTTPPSPASAASGLLAHQEGHPDRTLWFHGTRRAFTRFEHGHSISIDWNAHLGVHVADRPEAAIIATDGGTSGGSHRGLQLPARILEVRLADAGTLEVQSETELAAMALSLAHRQGVFRQGPPHALDYADMARARPEAVKQGLHSHVSGTNFRKLERATDRDADAAYRPDAGYPAQAVLAVHLAVLPRRGYLTFVRRLAEALRKDLNSRGVRTLTYPNDVEGGLSAIALDPDLILDPRDHLPWKGSI